MNIASNNEKTTLLELANAFFNFLSHTKSELPSNNPIEPAVLVRETLAWGMSTIPVKSDYASSGEFAYSNMCQVLKTIPVEDFFKNTNGNRAIAVREAIKLMARFVFQADWTPIIEQAHVSNKHSLPKEKSDL